jgi:hypothetical protein
MVLLNGVKNIMYNEGNFVKIVKLVGTATFNSEYKKLLNSIGQIEYYIGLNDIYGSTYRVKFKNNPHTLIFYQDELELTNNFKCIKQYGIVKFCEDNY